MEIRQFRWGTAVTYAIVLPLMSVWMCRNAMGSPLLSNTIANPAGLMALAAVGFALGFMVGNKIRPYTDTMLAIESYKKARKAYAKRQKAVQVRYIDDLKFVDLTADETQPPELANILLSAVLKPHETEHVLGDLEEGFYELQERHGSRVAKVWYWRQTIESLWPFIARTAEKLVKLGLFGWVARLLGSGHH